MAYELKKCAVEQRVNMTARNITRKRDVFIYKKKNLHISIMSHNSVGDLPTYLLHNHMAALRYIKLTHGLAYELKKCAVEQRVNMTARNITRKRDVFIYKKKTCISQLCLTIQSVIYRHTCCEHCTCRQSISRPTTRMVFLYY